MLRSTPLRPVPLFALLWLLSVAAPGAGEWNQWRGPARDGTVAGNDWPEDLGELARLWRVELGHGYPGPVVTPDRVFVAETVDGDTEVVRALDRASGQEIWRASWPGEGSVPFFAKRNGDWIRSTPAWDGESLFVGGMNEVLVSLDGETGRENWRVDFPARFGTPVPPFGFASSPLLADGDLYVQAADSLVKIDRATGETIWRTLRHDSSMMSSGAFSSPILTTLAGARQLVVQTRHTLNGVDPATGEVLWSQPVPNFRGMNILTPLVTGEGVFTSSYRNRSYFYRVERDHSGFRVEEAWNVKGAGYMSSPVLRDGHAYLLTGGGRLTCVQLESGAIRWTSPPVGKYWSLTLQGDKILALGSDGDLFLVRADPGGFELLEQRTVADQETWGHLAVSGDEIFVRELEAVAAYRWQGSQRSSEPGDRVAVATTD